MRFIRRPLRVFYPRTQFMIKDKKPLAPRRQTAEDEERPKKKKVNHVQPPRKIRVREGEADPKLAGAILELVQGPGAVRIPKEFVALHLDFAKAQFNGHMGARKFAQLNLARVKFYNPQLDIKVLRRPWAGKEEQLKYPCTATIYKRTGEKEEIDMRGKRSMKIYDEIIMKKMRALDLSAEYKLSEQKAEIIAKPYLKWA